MSAIIMSWGKCRVIFGATLADDAMAVILLSPGTVKDGSTVLSSEDGEKFEAKESGGGVVGADEGEKTLKLVTRVLEPELSTIAALLGGTVANDAVALSTTVIEAPYSVQVTPLNVGGRGIKVRRAHLSLTEGFNDKEGAFMDLTFTVNACADGVLLTKFTKMAATVEGALVLSSAAGTAAQTVAANAAITLIKYTYAGEAPFVVWTGTAGASTPPAGITVSIATVPEVRISGTPTAAGAYGFTVYVAGTNGGATALKTGTLTVN